VVKAFWLSILPAILLALVLAYILATMFVEPMEIFRRIDESAAQLNRAAAGTIGDDPLGRLSPRENEIAELVRRGLENKEIAEALVISPETVKKHLKNIKEKTGLGRVNLAVQAEARRVLSGRGATASP
jgi:DNA-binding NarL/FixJ family response regulator